MKEAKRFIICHIIIYLIGAFVAWELNPLNWLLPTIPGGRVAILIIEFFVFLFVFDCIETKEKKE